MTKKRQKTLNKEQAEICRNMYVNAMDEIRHIYNPTVHPQNDIPYQFVIKKIEQLKEELDD